MKRQGRSRGEMKCVCVNVCRPWLDYTYTYNYTLCYLMLCYVMTSHGSTIGVGSRFGPAKKCVYTEVNWMI